MTKSTAVSPQAVLEAARDLFASRGYRGTSMKDIAQVLAVSAPNLYNHVTSKQDLLYRIMDVAMDRALAALAAALDGVTDLADQLRRATEVTVLDFLENPAEVTVCNSEIRNLETPLRQAIIDKRDAYGAQILAIVDRGCAQGLFDVSEPRVASFAILEMGNNAKAWFHPDGHYTAAEVAALYGTFALRIVGCRPAER
ncbi:TetR/AcrR family transcriptional regulator [Amycolatopsis sp. DSM 110486]|uniref:TetR/AcrR family transcriptional regulator n=1 Tax=Amycolatopsis sp. DSM 110486 TaxID=2865832 RepID=UPI001C6A32B0|nr:TetR/AcrR family transcriptional regulator [Amycolatopsis sp. DSM 110486]QYN20963.1 TetR/AcrR family transcriptional regulator [Amycolatopsis sp. DSM 110486]